MLSDLLQDVSLFRILHHIDRDLGESCRQARCPYCQGPLHSAPYRRKPRGGPEKIPEEYLWSSACVAVGKTAGAGYCRFPVCLWAGGCTGRP
jgi:hypothetical protein